MSDAELSMFSMTRVKVGRLHDEFDDLNEDDLKELRTETFDRWAWDTGSDEDKELLSKLDEELDVRKKPRPRLLGAKWSILAAHIEINNES